MSNRKMLVVSHAPFWHNGSGVPERSYHTMLAAVPAIIAGFFYYGIPALGVVALSISTAIIWEWLMNRVARRPVTIGDGNAALLGLLFAMLLPPTVPWWLVVVGTFITVVIGKTIFGGIGGNSFHPVALSVAILMISWGDFLNFDQAMIDYDLGFTMVYPLAALKHFGTSAVVDFDVIGMLLGRQIGGIGATFGLGIILGGMYLIARGFIRWEISFSFLVGMAVTAYIFQQADPARYAGPLFHLCTGYTLIGAFFLATEDSSSPVNFAPMLFYGAFGGLLTVLIRNIGTYADGTVYAILMMNLVSPLLDKIRPKVLGKVV
jgi:Na+-translocating ferredoxin:NAD+ oxidoreductase subunit D